jgi:DNA polymerase-3 subunit beta
MAGMRATVERSDLADALALVGRAVPSRPQSPALGGILIEVGPAGAEVMATDGDLAMRVPLPSQAAQPGRVLVTAKLLTDVVKTLPDGEVGLELDEEARTLYIRSRKSVFDLRTLRSEDFMDPPPVPEAAVSLPGDAFALAIDQVARAVARDDDRPVLSSVLVSGQGQSLRLVATDSYRLSIRELRLDAPLPEPFEANVPARALQEAARALQSQDADTMGLHVTDSLIALRAGGAWVFSRLVAGHFPNYRQLLPETSEHNLRLPRAELLDAVRRVGVVAQKGGALRLSLSPGQMVVSARTSDVGGASEPLTVDFQGEPFDIGFSPEYLREGLDGVSSPDLVLKLISPLRPGVIEADEGAFIYLLMPIRLGSTPAPAPEEAEDEGASGDDPGF